MSLLAEAAPGLDVAFRELIDQYGFAIHLEDDHCLLLRSPGCVIEIVTERYEYGFVVTIKNPREVPGEYNYSLLMTMRCPGHRGPARRDDDSLTPVDKLLLDFKELCRNFVICCPDLLAGDFTGIRQEGYHEFASYVEARMPVVVNFPMDDPIAVKFWRGDFTWAKDLRERERLEGPASATT